jgi:ribonuclease BN (tRNA processing enzyme)
MLEGSRRETMKITVIGPWGAYPKAGEATAGYLLEHAGEKILIDCGSGVLSRVQCFVKLSDLTAVFITHGHYDHIADLGCLQYACLIDTDLNIRHAALSIYLAVEPGSDATPYRSMRGSEIMSFSESDEWHRNGLELSFFRTFHEVYCLGIKIKTEDHTLVYTSDTYYDDTLVDYCLGADLLIAEASFYANFNNARKYGHMNTVEVGELAKLARVKKLALTHLPHFGNIQELLEEVKQVYKGEAVLCESGLELRL